MARLRWRLGLSVTRRLRPRATAATLDLRRTLRDAACAPAASRSR